VVENSDSGIFINEEVVEEFHDKKILRQSGFPLEFDLFLPNLKLAFEYQGEQHFREIPAAGFGTLDSRKSRDAEKHQLCIANGITLIPVPYWWDNKKESLMTTILQNYPHNDQNEKVCLLNFLHGRSRVLSPNKLNL